MILPPEERPLGGDGLLQPLTQGRRLAPSACSENRAPEALHDEPEAQCDLEKSTGCGQQDASAVAEDLEDFGGNEHQIPRDGPHRQQSRNEP